MNQRHPPVPKPLLEFAEEEAREMWSAGDIPTVEEFGMFIMICVFKYLEGDYKGDL